MREIEGEALEKDLSLHLHTLQSYVIKLEKLAPNVVSMYKDRLLKKFKNL